MTNLTKQDFIAEIKKLGFRKHYDCYFNKEEDMSVFWNTNEASLLVKKCKPYEGSHGDYIYVCRFHAKNKVEALSFIRREL